MCICINCRHIHYCLTYQFIAQQHKKKLYNNNSKVSFTPINTIINININKSDEEIVIDWDLIECLSFVEKPGYWLNK